MPKRHVKCNDCSHEWDSKAAKPKCGKCKSVDVADALSAAEIHNTYYRSRNETDVLYGFINWLSECPNRVYEIGAANPQGHIHTALAKYCEENNLPELSDNWQDKIKKPDHFF